MSDTAYIAQQIVELHIAKQKHLDEWAEAIEILATAKNETTFYTGTCSKCEMYDNQIESLRKQLTNLTPPGADKTE